ncbi:calcium-binding protein [Accumulibacter sp.]|uniref:calcium-binding protein n=1 Tax=Accumulibacter sp. TaxID=2053492 RepID=UPI0028C38773|nr:calcium-binding protein [Accumulibacter sp.]
MSTINGTISDDVLVGTSGDDSIYGFGGNDSLDGGAGNDYLFGDAGNDTYLFSRGSGQDTVFDYDPNLGNLDTVQLGAGIATSDITISRDFYNLYIKINGSTDKLTVANWFVSNDYKVEQLRFDDGTTWNTTVMLAQISETATSGDDFFAGDSGANTFSGLGGNDTYVVDHPGDVVNENPNEGWDTVYSSITYTLPANVEILTLTGNAAINGTGNNLDNQIDGNGAANILDGGAGNDYLYGGAGNDTYVFGRGSGQDTVFNYDSTPGHLDTVQLGAGIATTDITISRDFDNFYIKINGSADKLTVVNWFVSNDYKVEQLRFDDGTTWNTTVMLAQISETATSGDDFFAGDSGANTFSGLGGNDTYVVDHPGDVVNENPNEGWDTVYSSITYTLPADVEVLQLTGNAAIDGTGNNLDNIIIGNDAANILDGGAGNDHLSGKAGDDTYLFGLGSGQDSVSDYDSTPGNLDTVQLGTGITTGDVTISRDLNNLYIKINGSTDELTLDNWFSNDGKIEQIRFANGTIWDTATMLAQINEIATSGDDFFAGDSGPNTFSGLGGNDTYIVDHLGDVVNENPNEGLDTVYSSITYTLPANVEVLTLTGNVAINGTGNNLDNEIYGNDAANILDGGAGNDQLYGGKGNDTYLFGLGSGQDYVSEWDSNPGNLDTVQLATGITTSDVTISRSGYDMNINLRGSTDRMTLRDWFQGDSYKIEQVKFADGTTWDAAALIARIPVPDDGEALPAPIISVIEGATMSRQDHLDGTATILVTTPSSGAPAQRYVNVPVINDSQGEVELGVRLPTGAGISLDGRQQAQDQQAALNDFIARIGANTDASSNTRKEAVETTQNLFAGLAAGNTVIVASVQPVVSGNQAPTDPLVIHGSPQSDGIKVALLIDTTKLPQGTIIQLDGIELAVVIGAARLTGGAGDNVVIGDEQQQFMVLGAGDDRLYGGDGDDTIGSLGGNDQLFGGAGNDTLFGGSGNDELTGGTGNDHINGGFGFDIAHQAGSLADYQVQSNSDGVVLTSIATGEVDVFVDIESIRFDSGASLGVAYSKGEAVAQHLISTWLQRDMTVAEGEAVQQHLANASPADIVRAFLTLPEASSLQGKSAGELLAGVDSNPAIIRIPTERALVGSSGDDQGYLPGELALSIDGAAGYDVLHVQGSRKDMHLEALGGNLELTQLNDGRMTTLKNVEMIAFDSGETVAIAHNAVEGVLGRLVHTFLNQDPTLELWRAGLDALAQNVAPDDILDWFQANAGLTQLNDQDYVQTLYMNTLQRQATSTELSTHLDALNAGAIDRSWLAVEIAATAEAAEVIGSRVLVMDGWM